MSAPTDSFPAGSSKCDGRVEVIDLEDVGEHEYAVHNKATQYDKSTQTVFIDEHEYAVNTKATQVEIGQRDRGLQMPELEYDRRQKRKDLERLSDRLNANRKPWPDLWCVQAASIINPSGSTTKHKADSVGDSRAVSKQKVDDSGRRYSRYSSDCEREDMLENGFVAD